MKNDGQSCYISEDRTSISIGRHMALMVGNIKLRASHITLGFDNSSCVIVLAEVSR